MDKLGYLSRINIMEVLPMEALKEVDRDAPMNVVRKGTIIMEPWHHSDVLFLLKEGRVRIYKISAEGKEFTLAMLGPGNIFGEIGSLSTGTEGAYAEALDDTVLCLWRKPDVERIMQQQPQLAMRVMEVLSARLKQMQELMGYLVMGDVRSRLLYLLLRLAAEFGAEDDGPWTLIAADLTHQDLAAMIGATRETVSATLAALSRDEVVRTGRKEIWVHRARAKSELDARL
ncbi:MAG: Crp/Fnr family transcriptional regulator [Bacillota bacterium]